MNAYDERYAQSAQAAATRPAFILIACTGACVAAFGVFIVRLAAWTWPDLILIYTGGTLCTWGAVLGGFAVRVLWAGRAGKRNP